MSRRFSNGEIAFLIGVPLAWGILLLFHPGGEGDSIYLDLEGKVDRWLVVHVGMMIFIPLFVAAVYLLLRGIEGTAAQVSRIALIVYWVLYGAFETLQGIGNGVLVDQVDQLPEGEREELVQDFAENILVRDFGAFSAPGGLALAVAMIAAGMALRQRADAPLSVAVLLGISGFLIGAHPPPFGPTGLVLFIVAVFIFVRSQSAHRVQAPVAGPGSSSTPA